MKHFNGLNKSPLRESSISDNPWDDHGNENIRSQRSDIFRPSFNLSITSPLVHLLTKESEDIADEKNREFRKKLTMRKQTRTGRKEHYSPSNMGFNPKCRRKLRQKPEWMTILQETNINERDLVNDLDMDNVFEIFNNEAIVFRLTDTELTQLKILLKEQMVLESDLQMGAISHSETIYSLVVNIVLNNGNLSKLSEKEQAIVLNLIQFINIMPSFDDDYMESAIELGLLNANEFVEFTDIVGAEIYVRKSSFVKSQILEDKIIEELEYHDKKMNRRSNFMVFCGVFYVGIKILFFVIGLVYSGHSSGYKIAMETREVPEYGGK